MARRWLLPSAGGELSESLDAPFTFPAEGERHYAASYQRDGRTLGMEVDLMGWRLLRRWDSRGEIGWPMLKGAGDIGRREGKWCFYPCKSRKSVSIRVLLFQQSNDGRVTAAGAVAECDTPGLWLWGSAGAGRWVAGHLGEEATTLTLTTPEGSVAISGMGAGMLVWEKGSVTVEATGNPKVTMG